MAREERTSRTWVTLVSILWAILGIGVVVLILWYGGVIGGGGNGSVDGSDTAQVSQEDQNGNGEEQSDSDEENGEEQSSADGNDGDQEESADGEEDAADPEGVFTTEQASRGQEAFSANCAECHGGQLDGNPPLSGAAFASTWDGMPVNALFEIISQTMPQDNPGSLDDETYADVTAHILAFNGMPEGDSDLQAGDSAAMETVISLGGQEDQDQVADGEESADGASPEAGDGSAEETDSQEAGAGEDAGAEGEDQGSTEVQMAEEQDLEEGAMPAAGEGWLDVSVDPEQATVNILGPGGYAGQWTGGSGTITGLEPGNYILAASLGNFSHRVDAEIRPQETSQVNLVIDELASSEDLGGGSRGGGETGGQAEGGAAENGEASNGQTGGGNGDSEADTGETGESGSDSETEAETSDSGEGGDNGEGSEDGEGEAWYTEEQAETGAEDYSASCASCHGEDGSGGSAPALADGAIGSTYSTVQELFEYTSTEMPDDNPGGLDEETYVNIVAHMLALNDYPAGDDELEADEEAMSDMSLEGGGSGGSGGDADDGSDGGDANGDQADEQSTGEADTSGAGLYSSHCAMCHGPSLGGVEAPPLAGPVFMERWGGHPVNWLYFQAHTSMPPDSPGSLDDQAYVDIIVYILAENGVLEGDEQFTPGDPLLENLIIGTVDQQDFTLQSRIDSLRRTLHEPFQEDESEDPETGADEQGIPVTDDTQDGEAEENGENGPNGEDGVNGGNGGNGEADEDAGQDDAGLEDAADGGGDGPDDVIDPEGEAVPAEGGGNGGEGADDEGGNGE